MRKDRTKALLSLIATLTSALLLLVYWLAPADEDHPYGHGRIETLITAAIGISLVVVALGIGYRAIATIRDVHLQQPGWIALLGALYIFEKRELAY